MALVEIDTAQLFLNRWQGQTPPTDHSLDQAYRTNLGLPFEDDFVDSPQEKDTNVIVLDLRRSNLSPDTPKIS